MGSVCIRASRARRKEVSGAVTSGRCLVMSQSA
jgi:hypothetical protein